MAVIDSLKAQYQKLFPGVIDALKSLDAQIAPRRMGKGCNLSKVPQSVIENGKLVPSRTNCSPRITRTTP
jgi:hypothetical protein